MVAIGCPSSPSSLQIRRGFNRSRPSCSNFLFRMPAHGGRKGQVRHFVVVSAGAKDGDAPAEPSADPFSGWSGEDSDEISSRKEKFEGFVGAGIAGLLFIAGVSFAALSFGRKNAGAPKELNPPIAQEESLLDADEDNPSSNSTETEISEIDAVKENVVSPSVQDDSEENVAEDAKASATVPEELSNLDLIEEPAKDDEAEDQIKITPSNVTNSSLEQPDSIKNDSEMPKLDTDVPIPVELSQNLSESDDTSLENKDMDLIESESSVMESKSEIDASPSNELVSNQDVGKSVDQLSSKDIEPRRAEPEISLPQKSFSSAGIPAPSRASSLQVSPGKIIVPAAVDQVQGQALAALQVLKVIEPNVEPGDICTRREYARWLVVASGILSRNTASKVYPAMYIENITDLAFDDVTPEDPDFPFIQGLAEAGLISSKLSGSDSFLFSPASPVSRQDLVSWRMALERRQLPIVDQKTLHQFTGYIDIDRISADAWPAIVADLSTRDHGIIPLSFGYTRLFQPDKPVTKAQAAIALTTGDAAEMVGEELARIEAESMADAAVAAHTALVLEVEQDLNASFEKELAVEKQKADAVEKLAQEARQELDKLRLEREEENNKLIRGRAAVESEMELLSRLRNELEVQLQSVLSSKTEMAFERERIQALRREAEKETEGIAQLQYELEVERKALSMARAWAEEEAKRASAQAKALEEARERWERHGLKIVVDGDLREEELAGSQWRAAGKDRDRSPVQETIERGESLVEKIAAMSEGIKGRSKEAINQAIEIISSVILKLKRAVGDHLAADRAGESVAELRRNAAGFFSGAAEGVRRVVEEGVSKMTDKFKTS